MTMTFGITFFVLVFLYLFVRRFIGGTRPEEKGLESYLRRHAEEAEQELRRMREETSRFNAGEALAPVEAGLRELLLLHNLVPGDCLDREGDVLVLRSAGNRVEVTWELRAAKVSVRGKSRNFRGNGHWQVVVERGFPELFAELAPLMGHLAALVRAMAKGESLVEEAMPGPRRRSVSRSVPGAFLSGDRMQH